MADIGESSSKRQIDWNKCCLFQLYKKKYPPTMYSIELLKEMIAKKYP